MSFAVWNWLKVYQRWRENYLKTRPTWRFPFPEEPIITVGPRGEAIKNKGIWIVLAVIAFLAVSSDS